MENLEQARKIKQDFLSKIQELCLEAEKELAEIK